MALRGEIEFDTKFEIRARGLVRNDEKPESFPGMDGRRHPTTSGPRYARKQVRIHQDDPMAYIAAVMASRRDGFVSLKLLLLLLLL